MNDARRLTRSESDQMVAGVCGGLGEYLGIDPTLVRIVFVVLAVFGGSGLVLYLALWLIVPRSSRVDATPRDVVRDGVDEGRSLAHQGADAARRGYERLRGTGRTPGERPGGPPPPDPGAPGPHGGGERPEG
jgi:phage shock protein C